MGAKTAVIIGAGPAGLTAAYELLSRSDIKPVVLEESGMMGGLSRTEIYKGNRIDIGGHRFFSRSGRVLDWWLDVLPLQGTEQDAETTDRLMLVRARKSRIYHAGRFFDYPLRLNPATLRNLGAARLARIALSYARARLLPIRDERSLEHFLINRFGRELYRTFFKSYTEKVWGVPCEQIGAAWGAQRIKGLSVSRALLHVLGRPFRKPGDITQGGVPTSLIERFLYPRFGPGQMWEAVAERILSRGGRIIQRRHAERIITAGPKVLGVEAVDTHSGQKSTYEGDYVFSSMPVQDLVRGLGGGVPAEMREIAAGLVYRDFITVGLLVSRLKVTEGGSAGRGLLKDNWIYIQEPDVRVGRLQIFNNWSPYLVADPTHVWLGLEYFCNEGDDLWTLDGDALTRLAAGELARIGIIDEREVLDATVIRVPKTYPAYLGTYERFGELRRFLDRFENLFLIGRNGMHRYNNQDHSMLSAMTAVDNIIAGRTDKSNIWAVNAEREYHEHK